MDTRHNFISYAILGISFFLLEVHQCGKNSQTPWTTLGKNCYHVSNLAMNWGEAQRYCWGIGGHLTEIMSREEEELLDTFLIGGTSYWLGLTDKNSEGRGYYYW